MAISDTQKIDYLWKKLGYGATKTDTNAVKKAPNEAIASPLLLRGDKVWQQASVIPTVLPGSSSGVVTVYPTSSPIECTEDATATANRTWKTGQTDWIPPEVGSTYQVKVYIHTASDAAGASGGTQVFATGSGNDDEWFFDYQSGVLHFVGTNLPNGVNFSGKSVYISGGRYTGDFGVGTSTGVDANIGNLVILDTTVSTVNGSADLILSPGSGIIDFDSGTATNLADPTLDSDAVTLGYLNSAISAAGSSMFADDTSVVINDDGVSSGNIDITVDNTLVATITDSNTEFFNNVVIGQTTLSGNTISSSGNLVLEPSNILYINSTSAMWLPTGTEVERPSNPEVGYFRFNSERESIEYWDGNAWVVPGQATITSDTIDPDGLTDTYTLSIETTDDAVLVSINGTLQQPTTAYSITGNSIQFAETPLTTDKIEVRHMTTAAALSQERIIKGSGSIEIVDGNAEVTGSLIPTANVTYDLGTSSLRWRDLYLAGNTIVMGTLTLSDDGGVLSVLDSDGFEAPLSAADPVADTDVVTLGYLNTELSGLSSSGLVADDTEIAINDDGIDPGNVEIIVDGANVATFTDTTVTFYANVVAESITNDITTANTAMQGYVDSAVNSANVGLKGYVDGEITTVGTAITTANTAMQGYVDDAISTLTSNAAVQAGAIADTNTAISTANTAMKGYVDNEISSLVDSAPDALNTLNELAAALGDDANLSTTLTTMISNVESNVSTLQSDVSTLTANAAVQAGAIATLTSNAAVQAGAIATLTSNAAVQAGELATLTANAAVQASAIADNASAITTANTAMQGYVDNEVSILTSNAAVQAGAIADLETNKAPLDAPVFTGNVTVSGNINLQGRAIFENGISEKIAGTKNMTTGNVIHDFSTGSIWIHNSISSDFTVDLTNVPTTNDRTHSIVLILDQAGTAYIPNGFKINGFTQTIRWADNTEPTGNAGAWDVVSFTLIRTSDIWIVFGVLNTFGTS